MAIQTFKEVSTSRAFDMEKAIVDGMNGDKHTVKSIDKKAVDNIIKFMKKAKVSGKARMPAGSYPTNSKKWDKYFPGGKVPGGTKTPKTDMIIGRHKVSLKTGPAQLTSGGKYEAMALYYNAVERSGKRPTGIVREIQEGLKNLAPSTTAQVKGNLGSLIKSKKDEIVNKANALNHKLKKQIKEQFASGGQIPYYFVEEAISGDIKFNRNDGTADYILVTDFNGINNRIHKTSNKTYVNYLAKQVRPEVRFKSSSQKLSGTKTGYYRYWSVIGLTTEQIVDNEFNMLQEELNQEGLLEEGFFDTLKSKGREVLDRINQAITNIKNKLMNFIKGVISFIKDSWENVLEFMGIEPEVSHNNYVGW